MAAVAGPVAKRSPQDSIEAREAKRRITEATEKYGRGKAVQVKKIRDKKLRGNLKTVEDRYKTAALRAKDAEILLENESGFLEPEAELERTYKVRQDEIRENVGIEVAKKGFELKLEELGPYRADYTRNGKNLLLAGRKGHVATMDWRAGKLGCELQLGETIRDAKWLHNNQFFAVAQKKNVYIYDHAGVELHCLNKHVEAKYLEFLPYHFLLASAVSFSQTSTTFYELTKSLGKQRFPQIYRYLHRPASRRTTYSTRLPNVTMPKPLECDTSRRSSKWYSHFMVTQFANRPCQSSCTSRSSTVDGY